MTPICSPPPPQGRGRPRASKRWPSRCFDGGSRSQHRCYASSIAATPRDQGGRVVQLQPRSPLARRADTA